MQIAAEHHPDDFADFTPRKHELLEIYRIKISFHRAKANYSYPTFDCPQFSKLAGLPTRIYQKVDDGALAFFVVVSEVRPKKQCRNI
ncbi:MAG: hypothetical protein ACXV2E_07155 [Halobacteriota archaeon]